MRKQRSLSDWQRRVLADLAAIAKVWPGDIKMLGRHRMDKSGAMHLRLRLRTVDIPHDPQGIRLNEHEDFILIVYPSSFIPPQIQVDHLRFLHHPHVLQGYRLCLYLDPSREWDPVNGIGGFLDRLVDWLYDAANGRFNAQTALYHAVGGVLHADAGTPTVVVRESIPVDARARHAWLRARTPCRFDLLLRRPTDADQVEHVPVVILEADLPFGAGTDLGTLLRNIEDPYRSRSAPLGGQVSNGIESYTADALLTALGASAIRKANGTSQQIIIAAPHPAGGPPHLLAASIPSSSADHIRNVVRESKRKNFTIKVDRNLVDHSTPLTWLRISDEREEVTIRRDTKRPAAAYRDRTVHVWGCGGLGSWIPEYVVRAGAKKVVLCDPSIVSGGLLVRQNFVETDIGKSKVEALAQRLRAISDTVEVVAIQAVVPGEGNFADADLIIDATVSVAIGRLLDSLAATAKARPILAQVAVDTGTGTRGVMNVSVPPLRVGPLGIDREVGVQILADGKLQEFRCLWRPPASGDEVIPTRGCSTPTFHGSAADLSAMAGSLVSILGAHLSSDRALSGTHLISLPHGESGPLRAFVPVKMSTA